MRDINQYHEADAQQRKATKNDNLPQNRCRISYPARNDLLRMFGCSATNIRYRFLPFFNFSLWTRKILIKYFHLFIGTCMYILDLSQQKQKMFSQDPCAKKNPVISMYAYSCFNFAVRWYEALKMLQHVLVCISDPSLLKLKSAFLQFLQCGNRF